MTMIEQFVDEARALVPLLKVSLDEPDDQNGRYWLDIRIHDFATTLTWSANQGFGFYTQDGVYGERPDEIYKKPAMAARRLQQLFAFSGEKHSDEIVPWLRQLRLLVDMPQTTVAEKLEIQQAAISRLESRSDIKLSSLIAYMGALGIELEIKAHNADFEMSVPLFSLQAAGKELN